MKPEPSEISELITDSYSEEKAGYEEADAEPLWHQKHGPSHSTYIGPVNVPMFKCYRDTVHPVPLKMMMMRRVGHTDRHTERHNSQWTLPSCPPNSAAHTNMGSTRQRRIKSHTYKTARLPLAL